MPSTRHIRSCICIAAVCAAVTAASAVRAAPDRPEADGRLVEAILEATLVDPVDTGPAATRVREAVERLALRVGEGRPGYHRAHRLHRQMHKTLLVRYDADADGLVTLLDEGRFNCLSATLFLGLAARRLGFEPVVLETPGHMVLGLSFRQRDVRIEATTLHGFDLEERARDRGAPTVTRTRLHGERPSRPRVFSLEQAVGFAWLNSAERALADGRPGLSSICVGRAAELLPDDVARTAAVHGLLAAAFRSAYESARFELAFRIAEIDVRLFPSSVSSVDRLLAAAFKRIELACESGASRIAMGIVADLRETLCAAGPLARLERRALPMIAAAAVRESEWRQARRAASDYAVVALDPVESSRLRAWVDRRSREATRVASPRAICERPAMRDALHGPG